MTGRGPISAMPAVFPSAAGSSDALLNGIWLVSLVLTALSLLAVLGLAIRRGFRDFQRKRDQNSADELQAFLRDWLASGLAPADCGDWPVEGRRARVLVPVLLAYFRTLAGTDLNRLKDLVAAQDLEAVIRTAARRGKRLNRMRSLALLSRLDTPSSLQVLQTGIRDPDPVIQLAALRGLARRQSGVSVHDIQAIATGIGRENQAFLETCLLRMAQIDPATVETLINPEADPRLLCAALQALNGVELGEQDIRLAPLARHADLEVRKRTARLVAGWTGAEAHGVIEVLMADPDPAVREVLVRALGRQRRADELTVMSAMLEDEDWNVRLNAALAMARTGPAGIRVLDAWRETDSALDAMIEEALETVGASV